MPAVSKAQQRFMGMVYAAKKGKMDNPSPEVKKAAASIKKKDAKDFAGTKHKGLPNKVESLDIEEESKKCKIGYYYCYTDKKCKPIPKGFKVVGRAGYLRKENGHSQDDDDSKNGGKNGSGNGNGNGNGGNGNGGGSSGSNGSVGESYDANDYNTLKDKVGSAKKHRKTFQQFMDRSKS